MACKKCGRKRKGNRTTGKQKEKVEAGRAGGRYLSCPRTQCSSVDYGGGVPAATAQRSLARISIRLLIGSQTAKNESFENSQRASGCRVTIGCAGNKSMNDAAFRNSVKVADWIPQFRFGDWILQGLAGCLQRPVQGAHGKFPNLACVRLLC